MFQCLTDRVGSGRIGSERFQNLTGRVGSSRIGSGTILISRVGSHLVRKFFEISRVGSGRVIPLRSDPREEISPVKSPGFSRFRDTFLVYEICEHLIPYSRNSDPYLIFSAFWGRENPDLSDLQALGPPFFPFGLGRCLEEGRPGASGKPGCTLARSPRKKPWRAMFLSPFQS